MPACHRPRTSSRARFAARPTALSLCLAIAGLGAAVLPPTAAHAQTAARQYDIPAGPLGAALTRFAAESGIYLGGAIDQTQGRTSPGLRGSYAPPAGLAALLAGTGLRAAPQGDGSFVLQAAPAAGAVAPGTATLATIDVSGAGNVARVTTEGSGSYTTPVTGAATRLALSPRETPQSVSVVTRQRLEDQALGSVADVLNTVTGVVVQAGDSDRTFLFARGYAIGSVMYDGVVTATQGGAFADSWQTDPVIYDRVEVVRGATGLLTGAGYPSASINLVRKRADSSVFTGSASVSAGSWNDRRATLDLSTPLNQEATVRGRVVGSLQNRESFIDRYETKKQIFYGVIDADLGDRTTLGVGADYQRNDSDNVTWTGLPLMFADGTPTRWSRSMSSAPDWAYWDSINRSSFATLTHRFGDGWELKGTYTQRRRDSDEKIMSLTGNINRLTGTGLTASAGHYVYDMLQNNVDVMLSGPFELAGRRHELVTGFIGNRTTQHSYNYARSALAPIGNFYNWTGDYPEPVWGARNQSNIERIHEQGLYLASRWSLADPLKLIVGSRYSRWSSSTLTAAERNANEFTPYAGLVFDIDGAHSVYASYTDIFQPQSNRDRNGAYLDPIVGKNVEAGVKGAYLGGRLNASLAVFRVKQDNLAQIDTGYFVPGTSSQAYVGASGVTTKGFEAEVSGQLAPGWNTTAGVAFANSEQANGTRVNTNQPRTTVRLYTTYRLPGAWQRLTVGGGINWQSSTSVMKTVTAGTYRMEEGGYTLVNLLARYDFSDNLSAQLNINNLFDKRYHQGGIGGYYTTANFGAPRNVLATMNYRF